MLNDQGLIYKVEQIRELERLASEDFQISINSLMESAGKAAFREMRLKWPRAKQICVICGKGNNGGDGYVLALAAHRAGFIVKVLYLLPPEKLKGAALNAAMECVKAKVVLDSYAVDKMGSPDLVVDAILGIGMLGEVSHELAQVIEEVNRTNLPVLAIDVPSGLDADSGKILGVAIKADLTVTFLGNKIGFFMNAGPNLVGELVVDNLNMSAAVYQKVTPSAALLNIDQVRQKLKPRPKNASKIEFGYVLVIGGNYGMPGAVRMAGEAALRVGAGLVNVITRKTQVSAVSSFRPELMCRGFSLANNFWNKIEPLLQRATVIIIGPGLGKTFWSKKLLKMVLLREKLMVLDADALNLLAKISVRSFAATSFFSNHWILTPHVAEAARLLHTSTETVLADMLGAAQAIQQKYGGVCVLKSARTIIRAVAGQTPAIICGNGNPGMATAGMGDVLSGVLGGLLAQGLDLIDAAQLGVGIHALAGDAAAKDGGERGLLATDLLPYLRKMVN